MVNSELEQKWNKWLTLLEQNGCEVHSQLQDSADEAQLSELIKKVGKPLPEDFSVLYQLSNGQKHHQRIVTSAFFSGYEFLSIERVIQEWENWKAIFDDAGLEGMADFAEAVEVRDTGLVRREYWIPGWVPFTVDGGGNSLAVDLDPGPLGTFGQVIVIGSDEDYRRVVAPSIGAMLSLLITKLQQGDFEKLNSTIYFGI